MSAQERNVQGMKLVEGEGNTYDSNGKALEGDKFNTVFIVVSLASLCAKCLKVRCAEAAALARDSAMYDCIT